MKRKSVLVPRSKLRRNCIFTGVSMVELNGSNTGVFYASCQKETDVAAGDDPYQVPLYQQERATVLSRAYGLKGPVAHFDTACASSFFCSK